MNRHMMQHMIFDSSAYGLSMTLAAMGPAGDPVKARVTVAPTKPALSNIVQSASHWLWAAFGAAALASVAYFVA